MITIPTILLAITIGSLYGSIQDYIDLLGGFCAVIISFIFPGNIFFNSNLKLGVIYIIDNDYPKFHWKNISIFILVISLALIGFFSTGITIYDMIKKSN